MTSEVELWPIKRAYFIAKTRDFHKLDPCCRIYSVDGNLAWYILILVTGVVQYFNKIPMSNLSFCKLLQVKLDLESSLYKIKY